MRAEVPSPEFSRFLYASVGGDIAWIDRLAWTYDQWRRALSRPGVETWVAYEHGTPAGYVELAANPDGSRSTPGSAGSVEIAYFGLLPAFRGRRIGGHLLSVGVQRAWDLGERWPDLPATQRGWLHTCSKDGEHALGNYQKRGFSVYRTTTDEGAGAGQSGSVARRLHGSHQRVSQDGGGATRTLFARVSDPTTYH